MSATVIAFPVQRRTKPPTTFYAALREFSAARAREALGKSSCPEAVTEDARLAEIRKIITESCEPVPKAPETEMLKLLRRIDRRLSRMAIR